MPNGPALTIRLTILRLFAALLLATIGAQAALPLAPPLDRTHGSAFSASTHEVAIGSPRRAEAARPALAPLPRLPAPQVEPATPRSFALAEPVAPRPSSTGPPQPAILATRAAPRAPPFA